MPLTKATRKNPNAANVAALVRRAAKARRVNEAAVLARQVSGVVLVQKVNAVVLAAKVIAADRPAGAVGILIAASRANGAKRRRRCLISTLH